MHLLMSSDVFFKTKSLGDISLSFCQNFLESFPRGFQGVPPVIFSWLPLELISSDSFRNSFLFFFLTYLSRNTNKDNFRIPCEFQSMILRFAEILYRSLDKNLQKSIQEFSPRNSSETPPESLLVIPRENFVNAWYVYLQKFLKMFQQHFFVGFEKKNAYGNFDLELEKFIEKFLKQSFYKFQESREISREILRRIPGEIPVKISRGVNEKIMENTLEESLE